MKTSKKIMLLMIVCLSIVIITPAQFNYSALTVEAHSGRTDRSGGHKDNKNKSGLGSYHYHHGYPAHLHTNGICPYANGYSSSSSSSSSGSTKAGNATAAMNANNDSTAQNSTNAPSNTNNTAVQEITISDTSYDNAAFNASYYASNHADVYKAYGDNAKELYNHFIAYGINEGRQSSPQFSILVYKENNQDLIDAFGDDLIKYYNHFIEYGVNENRVSK